MRQDVGSIFKSRSDIVDGDFILVSYFILAHAAGELPDKDIDRHTRSLDYWLTETDIAVDDDSRGDFKDHSVSFRVAFIIRSDAYSGRVVVTRYQATSIEVL